MNDTALQPTTLDEIQSIVSQHSRVLPIGNRTKPPLCRCADAKLVSLSQYSGIIQYEPSEFTFTAKAGTPINQVAAALSETGQYLPFNPMLADSGATLAGTVAAGLAGPGRFRYGGIRDFLLGVQFVAGDGALINSGGKVVKNAAGFDIPKLLVGSLGRLAVMTELTFKVFPRPAATITLRVTCDSHQVALTRIAAAASSRWECDAIDYVPDQQTMLLRLGGPLDALTAIAAEIDERWRGDVTKVELSNASEFWKTLGNLQPRSDDTLVVRVPTSPNQFLSIQQLIQSRAGMRSHLSVAGAVTWIWLDSPEALVALNRHLTESNLCGLVVLGESQSIWGGSRVTSQMESKIQQAMDPAGKFLSLSQTL